ncbi:MAG: ATP-binding cassette domain-containing protein [Oscillospiraceae bacterium]
MSFSIKKGETLGIVARTGSGKTTLINLFLRLYNVDRGTVFIGGHDILDIPLKVLRENIGYVPQDNFLFSDTIKNNIDFSDGTLSLEQVQKAAEFACVHNNIIEFKDGYDTIVGERGVTLSGGQKQRVAIARALIKDPEILILDDSVSAVDTATEEKILTHLKENRNNKTNIIIAHRISTLQTADHIIVIEDGKIAQQGTHEELIKVEGLYSSLYQKQLLEKDIEEEA